MPFTTNSAFSILTDATANIGGSLARRYGIEVLPFPCYLDGKELTCADMEQFHCSEYYDAIRSGAAVTTAQINPQSYCSLMEPLLQAGQDILFIGLSSSVSGSFASAEMARQELLERYPMRKIVLVDSFGASLGEGLLAIRAAKCRDNGMSLEETAQRLLRCRERMLQLFIVDDLAHLRRTGRLSNVSAAVGRVLGIRPILKGDESGKIVAFDRVRGRKHAIRAMAERYLSLVRNPALQTVGISHADCPEDAQYLLELLRDNLPPKEFLLVSHEPVTGSHIGPGALALYFEGETRIF